MLQGQPVNLLKPDILFLNSPKHQHSATPARLPQKRKRTSVARPSQPSPGQVSTASTSSLDQHDLLRYKNGHPRPYTLELGRQIKTELWERVGRPSFTESHLPPACSPPPPADWLEALSDPPPTSFCHQPAGSLSPPADSGKQLYPDTPPASLCQQPAGCLLLQTVASSCRASSCTLILYLPASASRPPSSADSGKQLKPDPPPTCLCHRPAGRLHLHMQTVARSGSLILHLPASATSLQAASTCRFRQEAVPLPSTCQPFPPACRPPPPADGGKQL
ncbi:hypothetical protein D9C73_011346 [Collichthys lucidus]|uniref:Uncharacterized protein n=1 Tax=Collichthys lucidus TaxID=240159 RepID=A0A4U5UUB0_COLLU|nr:hypothetical protein D9C73_011346 [Collichthys lucidus]